MAGASGCPISEGQHTTGTPEPRARRRRTRKPRGVQTRVPALLGRVSRQPRTAPPWRCRRQPCPLQPLALRSSPGFRQIGCQFILNTRIFWNLRDALSTQHNILWPKDQPLSPVVTGPSVSVSPGLCSVSAHPDIAADLDRKSSSSHSDHSSETSLPEIQKDKYLKECSLLKPQTKDGQSPEWTFYPRFSSNIHTYHVGKQCFFKGVFLSNRRSLAERTLDKCFGRKKYDIDPRNGIPTLTPGDNPYMYPEQSKDFYKVGATLPPVNFSLVPYAKKYDTFIPLEPLPQIPNLPFWVKEKANKLKNEIREVEELDSWESSIPLIRSSEDQAFEPLLHGD